VLASRNFGTAWRELYIILLPKDPTKHRQSPTGMPCSNPLQGTGEDSEHPHQEGLEGTQAAIGSARNGEGRCPHIPTLLDLFEDADNTGKQLHGLALDFRKAHDRLALPVIRAAMLRVGLPAPFIDFYMTTMVDPEDPSSLRTARIWTGHGASTAFPVRCGASQGTVLGVLVYLLCIDPLLCKLEKTTGYTTDSGTSVSALSFVDDTTLVAHSKEDLLQQLAIVQEFCRLTGAKLNEKKLYTLWPGICTQRKASPYRPLM
jgi:hypothetical protein